MSVSWILTTTVSWDAICEKLTSCETCDMLWVLESGPENLHTYGDSVLNSNRGHVRYKHGATQEKLIFGPT
jgi:hypothetical protein